MKFASLAWLGTAVRQSLMRPLDVTEALAVGLAILLVATIYCQTYCLIAFQTMHGQSMPALASVYRVSIDVLPAFLAFELSKRVLRHGRTSFHICAVIFIFAVAVTVATIARTTLTMMISPGDPLRKIVADRLQITGIAVVALVRMQFQRGWRGFAQPDSAQSDDPTELPPVQFINSIRAAGNYVEISFGGKSRLLRMPLKEVAVRLPSKQFVRVHRSLIVNRTFIAGQNGRRSIRLNDGTEVRVGDAYRSNLSPPS